MKELFREVLDNILTSMACFEFLTRIKSTNYAEQRLLSMTTLATPPIERRKEKRAPQMQARGLARRDQLMGAAITLMAEQPLAEISMAQIAARAGIPVGSAYHFYANPLEVFAALAGRFAADLNQRLEQPFADPDTRSWQAIVGAATSRGADLYNERHDYRLLLLGGQTPHAIRLTDLANDQQVGQILINAIERHFCLPDLPNRADVFFFAVEVVDTFFRLSQTRHGLIAPEMRLEATRASVGYLRTYLPEWLPPQVAAAPESIEPTPAEGNAQ